MKQQDVGFVFSVLVICLTVATWFYVMYAMERDVLGYIKRAQVAANAIDMAEYLSRALDGMERYGMTSGHAALLMPTPANDMGLTYQALKRCAERARELSEMPSKSTTYQVGLDDLRGTLRELDVPAVRWWFMRTAPGRSLLMLCAMAAIYLLFVIPLESRRHSRRGWW